MKSGTPKPSPELNLIVETKRNSASDSCSIVSEAAAWVKSQLMGAKVTFSYGACQNDIHTAFSSFTILRISEGRKLSFQLKIAEIDRCPFAFVDVYPVGQPMERGFPFFGEIKSEQGRSLVLNYVADFLLSSEAID
ncbi:MAG: hypothetical protein AAGJ81_10295 [Verrucomicrobiota bacterium]